MTDKDILWAHRGMLVMTPQSLSIIRMDCLNTMIVDKHNDIPLSRRYQIEWKCILFVKIFYKMPLLVFQIESYPNENIRKESVTNSKENVSTKGQWYGASMFSLLLTLDKMSSYWSHGTCVASLCNELWHQYQTLLSGLLSQLTPRGAAVCNG